MKNKISIKIGGPAGSGVFTIGLLLSKYFQRAGLNVIYTTDYPSLIKGGHNTCSVRAEDEKIYSEVKNHDVLVALDNVTIREDLRYLNKGGILICDEKESFFSTEYTVIKIPYSKLQGELDKRYLNTIGFGACVGVFGDDGEMLRNAINSHFLKKGDDVKSENLKAAEIGYNFSKNLCLNNNCGFLGKITQIENKDETIFLSGNDAAGLGALKAGVKFTAEYPMTPASSFLSFFAAQ